METHETLLLEARHLYEHDIPVSEHHVCVGYCKLKVIGESNLHSRLIDKKVLPGVGTLLVTGWCSPKYDWHTPEEGPYRLMEVCTECYQNYKIQVLLLELRRGVI